MKPVHGLNQMGFTPWLVQDNGHPGHLFRTTPCELETDITMLKEQTGVTLKIETPRLWEVVGTHDHNVDMG